MRKERTVPALLMAIIMAVAAFTFSGCMGGRVLLVDVRYDEGRTPARPFEAGPRVVLIPFGKEPGVADELGRWVGVRGREDVLLSKGSIEDAVTSAVLDYMKEAGLDVEKAAKGTDPLSYATAPPDVVMYGVIEAFSLSATSEPGSTTVKARVKLKVSLRSVRDGSVITVGIEGASQPWTVVALDPKVFSKTSSGILSDALERIFANLTFSDGVLKPMK